MSSFNLLSNNFESNDTNLKQDNVNSIQKDNVNLNQDNVNSIQNIPKNNNYTFNYIILFLIGLFLGMIIIILTFVSLYNTNSVVFTYCDYNVPKCLSDDYLNIPGFAIAEGYKADDIMFVNSNNELIYERPIRKKCDPGLDRNIRINNPQYCEFEYNGNKTIWKQLFFDSNIYENENFTNRIRTNENCYSLDRGFKNGKPVIKWDALQLY